MDADAQIVAGTGWILVSIRAPMTPAIQAVLHVLGGSVVSGRYNAPIKDNDGTDAIAEAVGPTTNGHRDTHEILMMFRQGVCHDVSEIVDVE
jgi:hypothetical protein